MIGREITMFTLTLDACDRAIDSTTSSMKHLQDTTPNILPQKDVLVQYSESGLQQHQKEEEELSEEEKEKSGTWLEARLCPSSMVK